MTLASGESPMFLLVVHQPASPSIWQEMQSLRRGLSTKSRGDNVHHIVTPGFFYVGEVEEIMCVGCEYYTGDIEVMDVISCQLCVNMI